MPSDKKPLDRSTFGSINGPIEKGIDSLIEKSDNPTTVDLARAMKVLHELIKKQGS